MGQCNTECTLKKFLVHFRRPQDYHVNTVLIGLRQSYVEGVVEVPTGAPKIPLCIKPDD